jgi:osmotically-inducible protein OsmY
MAAEEIIRGADDLPEADRRLLAVIRKTLWDYEPLRATRPTLNVDVDAGRVRLQGRVRTLAIKEIAEYSVHRLAGVRAVRNDLVADPEVVRAVADAIADDPELGPLCPRLDARDGVVVLTGDVPSEDVGSRLVELVSGVPLVEDVTSYLQVRPVTATAAPNGAGANGTATTPANTEHGNQ